MSRLLVCLPIAGLALLLSGCGGSTASSDSKTTVANPDKPATRADLEKQLADIKADIDKRKAAAGDGAPAVPSAAVETATSVATPPPADSGSGTEVCGLSGPITEPCAPAPGQLPAASAAARQYADQALRVAGFLALYPISADDQHRLRAHLLRNYEGTEKDNYAAVREVYKGIMRTSRDPISSAELRERYFAWLGPLVAAHPENLRTGLWGTIQKYNPVLLVQGGRTVTKGAVQDRLATESALAKAIGLKTQDQRPEAVLVAEGCRATVRDFASLPDTEKRALAQGESHFAGITQLLNSKSAARASTVAWAKASVRSEADLKRVHPELLNRAVAYNKERNNASMAAFRRDMNQIANANAEITRLGTLANDNTHLQGRKSATQ